MSMQSRIGCMIIRLVATDRRLRPGNYPEQARTYDRTRGASPSVVRPLSRFLGPAAGRTLLDIGGGTGNYAQVMQGRGFRPVVVDAQSEMVRRSVPKLGPGRQVVGDAEALPFVEGAFDCAVLVAALHQVPDKRLALREARRVIREGPFVLQCWTRENRATAFVFEYFPGSEPPAEMHPPAEQVEGWLREAAFARVERETYVYLDSVDGSLFALHTNALHLAGPAYLRNNSFFWRLSEDQRREGLTRLGEDLRSGVLERKVKRSFELAVSVGHGTVFAAWP
jgi:ubiquinone/menaquinone biosynthesis C-methylase UbiE